MGSDCFSSWSLHTFYFNMIMVELVAEEIATILTTIFQTSLDTATVPSDWRETLITPIYKKGPRNIPANYRPVSLTSVVSKMLEHIIFSSSMKHLTCISYKIIIPSQHGFRSKLSCETQLISTIQDISKQSEIRKGSSGCYSFRLCKSL